MSYFKKYYFDELRASLTGRAGVGGRCRSRLCVGKRALAYFTVEGSWPPDPTSRGTSAPLSAHADLCPLAPERGGETILLYEYNEKRERE